MLLWYIVINVHNQDLLPFIFHIGTKQYLLHAFAHVSFTLIDYSAFFLISARSWPSKRSDFCGGWDLIRLWLLFVPAVPAAPGSGSIPPKHGGCGNPLFWHFLSEHVKEIVWRKSLEEKGCGSERISGKLQHQLQLCSLRTGTGWMPNSALCSRALFRPLTT